MRTIEQATAELRAKLALAPIPTNGHDVSKNESVTASTCARCNGQGIYLIEGDERTFLCECERGQKLRRERNARLRAFSQFPSRLASLTFGSYRTLPLSPVQREAADTCELYATNGGKLDLPDGTFKLGLYLYGPVGTGKSGLAASVANAAMEAGVLTLYWAVPDLLDYLRATFNPNSEVEYDETFEQIKSVELLVLDDLGTERPSAWVSEKLVQLVDYRYRNHLRTIVTSNLDLSTLTRRFEAQENEAGKRIVSRLAHMCALIEVSGAELR